MFSVNITFVEALQITGIAMLIVFLLLYIVSLILSLFKVLLPDVDGKKVENQKRINNKQVEKTSNSDWKIKALKEEESMIAMLVASIESNSKSDEKNYRVVKIREIN